MNPITKLFLTFHNTALCNLLLLKKICKPDLDVQSSLLFMICQLLKNHSCKIKD